MQAIMEPIFDILYLLSVSAIGIFMIIKGKANKQYLLFGIMAVVLGFGDAFHLIPRVLALTTENGFEVYATALGIGKFITSITMTGFYFILYFIWREIPSQRASLYHGYLFVLWNFPHCDMLVLPTKRLDKQQCEL